MQRKNVTSSEFYLPQGDQSDGDILRIIEDFSNQFKAKSATISHLEQELEKCKSKLQEN